MPTLNPEEPKLIRNDNSDIARSLFETVAEDEFNTMERSIAIYLDEQEKLLWWYRNISRQDYYIQGWKRNKIYPDFIFADSDLKQRNNYNQVYVIETKGTHLKNDDTTYKQNVFKLCNELGEKVKWDDLSLEFENKKVSFFVIFGDEWREKINRIFNL